MLEFSIITISSFVTVLDETVKTIFKQGFKKDVTKFIPILSVVFGIALGIIGFYTPDVEMGSNLVEAIFIGLSAGSAATGVNQISKQLNKKEPESPQPIDISQFVTDQTTVINEPESESDVEIGVGEVDMFGNEVTEEEK